jgi:hypothetical protein
MKYAFEMDSDAKLHEDWFRHSKVNRRVTQIYRHTDRMEFA